jgi:hypothetical protein
MTRRLFSSKGLNFCQTIGIFSISLASCTNSNWQDTPVQITAKKPLTVTLGQDVDWSFEAVRGSRKLRIVDVSYNNLPLGVLKSKVGESFILKGKALSRELRDGLIEVTAFDEKACEEGYEQLKKLTEADIKATGNTNVAIPVSPCKLSGGSDFSNARTYMAQAQFAWQFVDGPDALTPDQYPAFVAENIFKTPRSLPEGMLGIPGYEAPHTVDVTLGACAALPRKECGKDPDCLWGTVSCISKQVTGRKASPVGMNQAAEAGVIVVPQEGIKR